MGEETRPPLTKLVLNNFVVQKRQVARQARTHTINGLVHQARRLRQKAEKDEQRRTKLEAKADRLVKEALFLKTVPPDEMMKFALLNKKSFAVVGSNAKASTEERALCRVVEHHAVTTAIAVLKEAHADWTNDLPHLIKGLGIRHREKKLQKLKRQGKLEAYLRKEEKNLKLLQELTGIDLKIAESSVSTSLTGGEEEKRKKKRSGGSSTSRKRKREQGMDVNSLQMIKKSKKGSKGPVSEGVDDDDEGEESDNKMGVRASQGDTSEDDESESDDGGNVTETVHVNDRTRGAESDTTGDDGENEDAVSEMSDDDDGADSKEPSKEDDAKSGDSFLVCGVQIEGGKLPINTKVGKMVRKKNAGKTESGKKLKKRVKTIEKTVRNKQGTDIDAERAACNRSQPVVIKAIRAAKVKQLDLERIKGSGHIDEFQDLEEEEGEGRQDDDGVDDDFFKQGTKKLKSSFFVRGTEEGKGDDGGDSEGGDSDGGSDGGSSGAVDTSKYFKRNLYRKREEERGRGGMRRGQGGGRGRGWKQEEGRGGMRRTKERGRGQKPDFVSRGRNRFTDQKEGRGGGKFSDKRGGRGGGDYHSETRKERRGREKEDFDDKRDSGGRGGRQFGGRRGGGLGGRGRGGEGRRQFGPGRGGEGRRQFGSGRGGEGRRQFGPGRGGKGLSHMDSDNPNFVPVTSGGPVMPIAIPATTTTTPGTSLLHPSWLAKRKERQQSSALSAFQGKRVVFD